MSIIPNPFSSDDKNRATDSSVESANQDYSAIQLTDELVERFQVPDYVQPATSMRPYKDDGGVTTSKDILNKIYSPNGAGFSFELAYGDVVDLRVVPENIDVGITLRTQLQNQYPNSEFEQVEPDLLNWTEGRYVAVVKLSLQRYGILPIENAELAGWDCDPLGGITSEMSGLLKSDTTETDVVVQTRLEPASDDWHEGVNHPGMERSGMSAKNLAFELEEPTFERRWKRFPFTRETIEHDPSPVELDAAKLIQEHAAKPAWKANVYVIVMSTSESEAKKRARKTAKVFNSYYQADTRQGFEATPLQGTDALQAIDRAVAREFEPTADHFSDIETVGLFHVPKEEEMNDPNMVWAVRKKDGGVPATSPKFEDHDAIGYYADDFPDGLRDWYDREDMDWPFTFTPSDDPPFEVTERGHELGVNRLNGETTLYDDEDIGMGAWPAAMVENHRYTDDSPYFIGVDDNGREVPILQKHLNRHLLALGLTGSGKSTAMNTIQTMHFNRGAGGVVIDPGGEDTFKQLMALDPDRYDDVVVIDAGSDFSDYQIGMNILETYLNPGDPGFHAEVDATIDAAMTNIGADDYARMRGIASHMFRGLIEADYMDADRYDELADSNDLHDAAERKEEVLGVAVRELVQADPREDYTYTVEDAYTILDSKENREEWHRMMVEQDLDHLAHYAKTLAELDDDDSKLEPLLRRFKELLESPNFRPLVAQRQNTINLADLILNGKILFVKADTPTKQKRKMISGIIGLKTWHTILNIPSPKEQRRMELEDIPLPGNVDHENYDGFNEFYLTIDEVHSVITPEMDLEHMLAEARKRKFGLFLLTQQFVQIPADQRDELVGNFGHVFAWDPGNSSKEKAAVASMFPGIKKDELKLGQFKAWTMITDEAGDPSDPFVCHMFPPVLSKASFDRVHSLIREKEEQYGIRVEDIGELGPPPRFDQGEGVTQDGETDRLTDEVRQTIIETAYYIDARMNQSGAPKDDLKQILESRIEMSGSVLASMIERTVAQEYLAWGPQTDDGDTTVTVTEDGLDELFNTGSSGSGGGVTHRKLIANAFADLTRRGLIMRAVVQDEDGGRLPDAIGYAPIQQGGSDWEEAKQAKEDYRDQEPISYWLTGGKNEVRVEAESRGLSKPKGSITNWAKAANDGVRCLFVVDAAGDDNLKNARKLHQKFTEPPCLSQRSPAEISPERSFYTGGNLLVEGDADDGSGVYAVVPDSNAPLSWVELDGEMTLWRSGEMEAPVTQFSSVSAFEARSREDFPAVYKTTEAGEYIVWDVAQQEEFRYSSKDDLRAEWTLVKMPCVPELVFDDGIPSPEEKTVDIFVDIDGTLVYYDVKTDSQKTIPDACPINDDGKSAESEAKSEAMTTMDDLEDNSEKASIEIDSDEGTTTGELDPEQRDALKDLRY